MLGQTGLAIYTLEHLFLACFPAPAMHKPHTHGCFFHMFHTLSRGDAGKLGHLSDAAFEQALLALKQCPELCSAPHRTGSCISYELHTDAKGMGDLGKCPHAPVISLGHLSPSASNDSLPGCGLPAQAHQALWSPLSVYMCLS